MQLEFDLTDIVEKNVLFLIRGEPSMSEEYGKCDICARSTVAITFKLRHGADRGHYPGSALGSVTLCLECVEEISQLYEQNRDVWNERWNETLDKLRQLDDR